MLFISGSGYSPHQRRVSSFNLAIEMLFISGSRTSPPSRITTVTVSISQSRCFSFQARQCCCSATTADSFNLAIEMLFISGERTPVYQLKLNEFQSRNRDAFHFRTYAENTSIRKTRRFNLAIEMLFISGQHLVESAPAPFGRFNLAIEMLFISGSNPPCCKRAG